MAAVSIALQGGCSTAGLCLAEAADAKPWNEGGSSANDDIGDGADFLRWREFGVHGIDSHAKFEVSSTVDY